MLRKIILSLSLLTSLFISFGASACDDKPCEAAYISSTERYMANHIRRANTYRLERLAHSKNRERRDYALYVHLHLLHSGRTHSDKI